MVIDSFHPDVGGSETAVWRLSEALVELGHTVGVAVISRPESTSPSEKFLFWNVPSTCCGVDAKFLGKIHNLRSVIRAFRPDVVNVHFMLESGYVGVKAAHAEGIPCVLTNRGKGLYNKAMCLTERLLYPFWNRGALGADAFIATSQEMVDMAKQRYGIDSIAISNGVDANNFTPEKDGRYLREKFGVNDSQSIILCARRLVPKNGIEYIVRALPAIRQKMDTVLWLAAAKIREYPTLLALATELGVADHVRFLGEVDHSELPNYFAAADIVVQPSIAEARSLACLEAMASGRAVVATDTGGLSELITHEKNGYLIPAFQDGKSYVVGAINPAGVANLGKAVVTVLQDADLRHRLEGAARAYALTCSWPEIARETLQQYQVAIDRFHSR